MHTKWFIMAAALLSPVLASEPAMALDTAKLYRVRFEGNMVGTWRVRNRVVDVGTSCRYTIQWQNLHIPHPLKRTVLCSLDERKASDEFDCEVSRRGFFDTLVHKPVGINCTAFDEFGQQTNVRRLIGGESSSGFIAGVVEVSSVGDVQSLLVVASP
ncbi:MAG: hypothetical protein RMK29_17365 [Myxococcales bacterium]|nr:hypothetical protein [Myxococcota bacterium]MDW8283480.1 hypothetical protein [Myxococcales bacterium]